MFSKNEFYSFNQSQNNQEKDKRIGNSTSKSKKSPTPPKYSVKSINNESEKEKNKNRSNSKQSGGIRSSSKSGYDAGKTQSTKPLNRSLISNKSDEMNFYNNTNNNKSNRSSVSKNKKKEEPEKEKNQLNLNSNNILSKNPNPNPILGYSNKYSNNFNYNNDNKNQKSKSPKRSRNFSTEEKHSQTTAPMKNPDFNFNLNNNLSEFKLSRDYAKEKNLHQNQINEKIREEHETEMNNLKQKFHMKLAQLEREHDKEIYNLESRYNDYIENIFHANDIKLERQRKILESTRNKYNEAAETNSYNFQIQKIKELSKISMEIDKSNHDYIKRSEKISNEIYSKRTKEASFKQETFARIFGLKSIIKEENINEREKEEENRKKNLNFFMSGKSNLSVNKIEKTHLEENNDYKITELSEVRKGGKHLSEKTEIEKFEELNNEAKIEYSKSLYSYTKDLIASFSGTMFNKISSIKKQISLNKIKNISELYKEASEFGEIKNYEFPDLFNMKELVKMKKEIETSKYNLHQGRFGVGAGSVEVGKSLGFNRKLNVNQSVRTSERYEEEANENNHIQLNENSNINDISNINPNLENEDREINNQKYNLHNQNQYNSSNKNYNNFNQSISVGFSNNNLNLNEKDLNLSGSNFNLKNNMYNKFSQDFADEGNSSFVMKSNSKSLIF